MLFLLRKIRRKLISSDNKSVTYLLYAIGEITLVVVGILIAVSIDDLNEHRKQENKEYEMLVNLKKELALDTIDFKWNLDIHRTFLAEEKKLYGYMQGDSRINPDSINYTMALGWSIGTIFHTTSYNNLLNQDNDLIKNEELRKKIFSQYDYFYKTLLLLEHEMGFYQIYQSKEDYFKKHFIIGNHYKQVMQSGQGSEDYWEDSFQVEEIKPRDVKSLRSDAEFAFVISRAILKRTIKISMYEDILSRIDEIIDSIDDEINQRFK
jgi:hypothetical protein